MATTGIHTFVMAGGTGTRLQALTRQQCKPSLPFCAEHRVIDFVLANLQNSALSGADLPGSKPRFAIANPRWPLPASTPSSRDVVVPAGCFPAGSTVARQAKVPQALSA